MSAEEIQQNRTLFKQAQTYAPERKTLRSLTIKGGKFILQFGYPIAGGEWSQLETITKEKL